MSILIFGGTVEGRTLAEHLSGRDVPVTVCVATDYGASMMQEAGNLHIISGRQTPDTMLEIMEKTDASVVADATHPYSQNVTENILAALQRHPVPYIRVERELEIAEDSRQNGRFFDTIKEAVDYLNTTEGKVLITTGSKELESYTEIRDYETRCVLRALPALPVSDDPQLRCSRRLSRKSCSGRSHRRGTDHHRKAERTDPPAGRNAYESQGSHGVLEHMLGGVQL